MRSISTHLWTPRAVSLAPRCMNAVLCLTIATLLAGCVPMTGVPSMSLMTRDLRADSPQIAWVGPRVEKSETMTWALFFLLVGENPTHESVTDRLLDEHDADVLLDAELHTVQFGLPYIFLQFKTTASGRPARFKN